MPLDFTGLTTQEIAAAKATAIADALVPLLPLAYSDVLDVTIWSASVEGGNLHVRATATSDGMVVPSDSLYIFVNPPIDVDDGAGGAIDDPLASGKSVIHDALLRFARSNGANV